MLLFNCIIREHFLEAENDAESCLRALKFDNLSSEHFDTTWKACSRYRLKGIRNSESTSEIFETWPFYKEPTGFRLVSVCK